MPIYEYKCTACEHEFEAIQKFSDEPLLVCPGCNKEALKKKISAAAFRLKGGGWYETDFKSGNKKNLAGDADKSKDGAKSEKAESKASPSGGDVPAKSGSGEKKPGSAVKESSKPASPA